MKVGERYEEEQQMKDVRNEMRNSWGLLKCFEFSN